MIVKNESKIITRLFDSLLGLIDFWIISDTGSNDNTKEIISSYFKEKNIPGHICEHTWKNFGHNRTLALREAQNSNYDFDYILLLDADMKLVIGNEFNKNKLKDDVYHVKQGNNNISYYNTRLLKKSLDATCISPTHEYYDIKGKHKDFSLSEKILFINDIGDGGAKSDKYERDIKLLTDGIKDEPDNPRYYFYLAQSYRCISKNQDAIKYYLLRTQKGGWYEEIWYSYYQVGNIYMEMQEYEKGIYNYLMAYSINKGRVENIYKIAEFYRTKTNYALANHFIDMGLSILKNSASNDKDILFKVPPVYDYLMLYEKSINAYYSSEPNNIRTGLEISNYLMLNRYKLNIDGNKYNLIISNLRFYLSNFEKIGGKHIKIFTADDVKIKIDKNFKNFYNPSIINHNNDFYINIRTSNYSMNIINNHLCYKVYDNDNIVDINNENPVVTKNIICGLNKSKCELQDLRMLNFDDFDLFKFNFTVKGIEDIRLLSYNNDIYFVGNSREVTNNNSPKMLLGKYSTKENKVENLVVLHNYEDNQCQKNWSPFVHDGKILLFYSFSPLVILEPNLETGKCTLYKKGTMDLNYEFLRGGSQGFYIKGKLHFITHEVIYENGRIYLHRFVKMNEDLSIDKVSYPFYMKNQGIEYISGAVYDDDKNEVLITWGSDDKFANLSSISFDKLFST
jgi:tetratricopeptide (TPR) repeat protein